MANIAKLKKKGAELELKKQPDKALAVYIELLQAYEENPEEMDVALYNRVGDLLLRQGSVSEAVDYYERAVDHYAEGGFHNNAIALCNKILRQSPGRTSIYYKLGKISAQKGFTADAKRNFLEFADRMQKAGKLNEAFEALKEFADLCPDQDDIRLMLADQLQKANKSAEAVEQLQLLYQRYMADGRKAEADATAARIRSIDPTAEVRAGDTPMANKAQELVFLDLDDAPAPRPTAAHMATPSAPPPVQEPEPQPELHIMAPPELEPADEPLIERTSLVEDIEPDSLDTVRLDGVTHTNLAHEIETTPEAPSLLEGLQSTTFDQRATGAIPASMLDLETTSLSEPEVEAPAMPTPVMGTPTVPTTPVTATPAVPPPAIRTPVVATPAVSATPVRATPAIPSTPVSSTPVRATPAIPVPSVPTPELPPLTIPTPTLADAIPAEPLADEIIGGDLELILPDESAPEAPAKQEVTAPSASLGDFDLEEDAAPAPARPTPPRSAAARETPARTTAVPRPSSLVQEHSLEMLQAVVEGEPNDWNAHRELGEALLEAGDREAGLREFETAMRGYETDGDLDTAASVADEIVRTDPSSVKFHQKRVEYAYRANDKVRLVDAYLNLADALFRGEQVEKARTIYHRVLEISPDNARALGGLSSLPETVEEAPAEPAKPAKSKKAAAKPTPSQDADFINLGDLMRDDEPAKDLRMVVEEKEPTGDEEADFADMLRKFKQGVAENVEAEDYQSHYDLGIAYKEMGLLDEAISEFQTALRGKENRGRTYEAIGQCFMEKEQYQMANTLLQRALSEEGMSDDKLVGVLYLLGRANEALKRPLQALEYYQRVFVIDLQFRDVGERMNALEQGAR